MRLMRAAILVALLLGAAARRGKGGGRRRMKGVHNHLYDTDESQHWSDRKWEEVEKATAAEAVEREHRAKRGLPPLPLWPAHSTVCGGRACRPGEGNIKHDTESGPTGRRYKMWGQPYEHREQYVQSRSRRAPHAPNPDTVYAGLAAAARAVARDNLVVMTSGDFDYRELVVNWVLHVRKTGRQNALVYAMDGELHAELTRRGMASYDGSALVGAWNSTCLQRHVQAVRMERHLAAAALVAAGLDVLYTDATAVFVRDAVPYFMGQPAEVQVMLQRDDWPQDPVRSMGTSVNAGFIYLRSREGSRSDVVRLVQDAVDRGLIEFYLRWNNIPDQYGWAYVLSGSGVRPATSEYANETTTGTIKRWKCGQADKCLGVGFLPYDRFPRHLQPGARWVGGLDAKADVYHLTFNCAQEQAPCSVPDVRPFRGNRQRLNRYDETDFEDMRATLKGLGLWLADG